MSIHNKVNTLSFGCYKLVCIRKQPKIAPYKLCALCDTKLSTICKCENGQGLKTKYYSDPSNYNVLDNCQK